MRMNLQRRSHHNQSVRDLNYYHRVATAEIYLVGAFEDNLIPETQDVMWETACDDPFASVCQSNRQPVRLDLLTCQVKPSAEDKKCFDLISRKCVADEFTHHLLNRFLTSTLVFLNLGCMFIYLDV